MKAALLIPCYNKSAYVERCLRAALAQTEPCEIVIFGPKSTDDTDRKILGCLDEKKNEGRQFSTNYDLPSNLRNEVVDDAAPLDLTIGHHRVCIIRPPKHEFCGMNAGVNVDFNWLMNQIDADWCLFCSADDEPHPDRVKRTMEIAEEFNPSWIVCEQIFTNEEGTVKGHTGFPDRYTRWISMAEGIKQQCGSSGGFAWSRDLYLKYGPMKHIESNDVILAAMSLFERGMYYIHEPLMTMYLHDDLNNVGVEGQLRGARTEAERVQLSELNNFQATANWFGVLDRIVQHNLQHKMSDESKAALEEKVVSSASFWVTSRGTLTMMKIPPIQFGAKALGMME